ncbi:MAG: hypothetical protein CMO55_08550 [Verrucomicrobiales bacterium]|nr:hypothetical protein [Verrucomicrobiales bacterium]
MKYFPLVLSLVFVTQFGFSESVREIAAKFEAQKIEAVQKYLDENPDASDKDEALSILIGAHMATGTFEPIPALLDSRYELQPKGMDADPRVILQEIVQPYIQAAVVSDQRDKAKAFLTKVKGDFSGVPQAGQILQILDQWGSELYLPGVGDKMEIAFTDLEGNEVDTTKMTDKVILVDFWATWCGPCVAEMPNVIAAYNELHEEGFEVIGISLDEEKSAVEKFVSDNNMPWPQYFDGKGWGNELAQKYGISGIPATFLIGKDGTIVASNLRGPALEEAVKKELGTE